MESRHQVRWFSSRMKDSSFLNLIVGRRCHYAQHESDQLKELKTVPCADKIGTHLVIINQKSIRAAQFVSCKAIDDLFHYS